MIRDYPALNLFLTFGKLIASGAGFAVFAVFACVAWRAENSGLWLGLGALIAMGMAGLLLVLRDIVKVIADTLIPAP